MNTEQSTEAEEPAQPSNGEVQPGESGFTAEGAQVFVIQKLVNGKFLVEYVFENEEEPYIFSQTPVITEKVYRIAPTEKLDYEVARKQKQINALDEEIARRNASLHEIQKVERGIAAKTGRHEALKQLLDFIDGKITHYFIRQEYGAWSIEPSGSDKLKGRYNHEGDVKLLSLFGRSNGSLTWKVNQYYDGSGTWQECLPFCSESEAIAAAAKAVMDADPEKPRSHIVEFAKKYSLPLPYGYEKALLVKKVKTLSDSLASKQRETEAWQKELHAVTKQLHALAAATPLKGEGTQE